MKKLVSIAVLWILVTAVFGQAQKGQFMLGGSADISASRTGKNSSFNLSLSPTFGAFVVKGLAIGGRYSFSIGNTKNYDNNKKEYVSTTTFSSGIGPVFKYYIGNKPLKGLVSLNANYLTVTTLRKSSVSGTNGFSVGGSAGIAYFLNPHLALESAFYTTVNGYKGSLPTTRIGFQVGFFVFVDKKKKE